MTREELITSLQKIVKPYVQDQEAFKNLSEETDFINDLKINSANLVDIILDVEDEFDIEIDNDSMEKMLSVKAYCCFNSNARDFARFGKLYKDFGKWNGIQILDSSFVVKSIKPRFEKSPEYGYGFWLGKINENNFFAMRGILGQYVIILPEKNIIIVRLGQRNLEKNNDRPKDFDIYLKEALIMLESVKV